jgi:hypothetical protein
VSHFREALENAQRTSQLLALAKTVKDKAEAQIFVKEGVAFAVEKLGNDGGHATKEQQENSFKEVVCRAASKEGPEQLAHFEELFDYKLPTESPMSFLELLGSGGLRGIAVLSAIGGAPCPGCPNCQPERFDPNTITVEGHTVSEERTSEKYPRQLLPKSR